MAKGVILTNFNKSKVKFELTKKLNKIFGPDQTESLQINRKDDRSFVTDVDLFVSDLIKESLQESSDYGHYTFFSEEDHDQFNFPISILDPIDGTRELVKGKRECAVSLAMMHSPLLLDNKNYGWIYNPFTGFDLDSNDCFIDRRNFDNQKYLGMVSRSEFEKGHYQNFLEKNPLVEITPRGSIAFKLGLLATGACDFVISLSPKNIWDIAAGSVLCAKRGIKLYQNGVEIKSLDEIHIKGILLWSYPEIADYLHAQFKNEK